MSDHKIENYDFTRMHDILFCAGVKIILTFFHCFNAHRIRNNLTNQKHQTPTEYYAPYIMIKQKLIK